jgi:hypothetical protein
LIIHLNSVHIVLHPRHKLQYFKATGWEQEWIDTAEEIVRDEFEKNYAVSPVVHEKSNSTEASRDPQKVWFNLIVNACTDKTQNMFDNLPALAAPRLADLRDELARYLSTDPKQVKDVLQWWTERKATFPCLSRMALDYLSILGNVPLFLD